MVEGPQESREERNGLTLFGSLCADRASAMLALGAIMMISSGATALDCERPTPFSQETMMGGPSYDDTEVRRAELQTETCVRDC